MSAAMMAPTMYEAEVEDPQTGEKVLVRALSLSELEVEIDTAFGIFTDDDGRDLGVLG